MRNIDLSRYNEKFKKLLADHKAAHDNISLRTLCANLNIDVARISEINAGSRDLTGHYLEPLILGGIMTVDQILGSDTPLTDREKTYWQRVRAMEDKELVDLLNEARDLGIDPKGQIKAIIETAKSLRK